MRGNAFTSGWRGTALIAVTYVYFLIFAQFAFLRRLAELGIDGNALKVVMAAMAVGGILLSLLTPRTQAVSNPATRLRLGLAISAIAALLTLSPLGTKTAPVVAFLIGAGLGITTVTLVTHLRMWTGERRGILHVGLGTGLAYLICNVPAVFTASARDQAILAAALCLIAMALPLASAAAVSGDNPPRARMSFGVALASFAALIWLDSAAFYIIQHTQALKAGTWLGDVHLWINGGLHFGTAMIAAFLLQRGRVTTILTLAFGTLAFACVLLQNPSLILSASLFYPMGVSLYSVALVAYPSFLAGSESSGDRGRKAGWIYAVAGWIGSALGIGMGQNLGHVPLGFVAAAGLVLLAPLCVAIIKYRTRELALVGAAGTAALLIYGLIPEQPIVAITPVERGRQIYISEGCISCHSQYVRPDSPDTLMWGPTESLEEIHAQRPPLIGNRRQGPDLSQVGLRRSPLWLKAHLISPAEISYHSPMPSFAFLFSDSRGSDLVAYLSSLRGAGEQLQLQREAAWAPAAVGSSAANAQDGELDYERHCATCHDLQGATRMHWLATWRRVPQPLSALREHALNQSQSELARIAKFGIPGTDMPGHEYLSDGQIASIVLWLKLDPMQTTSRTSPQ